MTVAGTLTKNQGLVLDTLAASQTPLSAYAILDALRPEGLRAPLQVYRALEKLQERGLVHRIESLNAFIACGHPHCREAEMIGFAICERCGTVDEFAESKVIEGLKLWAERHAFKTQKATIEIRGICSDCSRPAV